MHSNIRTLITDIKATARIGHAVSLLVAFDGLLDLPQVSGNLPMNAAFSKNIEADQQLDIHAIHFKTVEQTLNQLDNLLTDQD